MVCGWCGETEYASRPLAESGILMVVVRSLNWLCGRTTNFDHIFTSSFQIGGIFTSRGSRSRGLGASEPLGQSTAPSALFHRRRQLLHPLSFPLQRIRCTCCGSTARAPIVWLQWWPLPLKDSAAPHPAMPTPTPLPLHHMVLPPCARSWAPRPPPSSFSSSFHRRPPARCLRCDRVSSSGAIEATPRCASCNSSCVQRLPLLLHLPAARAIHRRRLRVHVLRHVDEHCCANRPPLTAAAVSRDPRVPHNLPIHVSALYGSPCMPSALFNPARLLLSPPSPPHTLLAPAPAPHARTTCG